MSFHILVVQSVSMLAGVLFLVSRPSSSSPSILLAHSLSFPWATQPSPPILPSPLLSFTQQAASKHSPPSPPFPDAKEPPGLFPISEAISRQTKGSFSSPLSFFFRPLFYEGGGEEKALLKRTREKSWIFFCSSRSFFRVSSAEKLSSFAGQCNHYEI